MNIENNPAEITFFYDSENSENEYNVVTIDNINYFDEDFESVDSEEIGYGEDVEESADEDDYIEQDSHIPLPVIHCAYCNNYDANALAFCVQCNKWFCNSKSRFGSHIFTHLLQSGHKSVRFHPQGLHPDLSDSPLCCFNNQNHTNVFDLGTIQNDEGYMTFICRDQCLNKSRLKEIGWDADTFSHIIKDKHFVSFLLDTQESSSRHTLAISLDEILDLERMWKDNPDATLQDVLECKQDESVELEEVPQRFDTAAEYNEIFIPLINLERESDKEDCESKRIDNVMLRWENDINNKKLAIFHLNTFESRYRMTVGQTISFHLPVNYTNAQDEYVYSGEIIYAKENEIRVKMNDEELPLGKTSGYYVTFSWTPTTFDRMVKAVRLLFKHDCMSASLYNQLLGFRTKPVTFPLLAPPSISIPNFTELNESQILAVKAALQNDLTLIQGPPGTGKTVTSATIVYHLVKSYKQKVLVCAPSNIAVDNLAYRIAKLGLNVVRVVSRTRESVSSLVDNLCLHNIACLVGGPKGTLYKLHQEYLETGQLPHKKAGQYKSMMNRAEELVLKVADVVCCTCVTAGDERIINNHFTNVLIDESTQACEPECLIPIVRGCRRLIMVGDQQQLGPVILNPQAKRAGFNVSMFERLLSLNIKPYRLKVQYRMHPALSEFSSNYFYNGELQNGVHAAERTRKINFPWPRSDKPIMFWTVNGTEDPGSSGRSYQNRDEANCVIMTINRLLSCGITGDRIGVITPYDSQRSLICQLLSRQSNAEEISKIEVCSVDEFQGREKDYIIFTCVRSNGQHQIGFLRDTRRLNVGITRAKYGLVIIGNPNTLKDDMLWLALLNYYQNQKCLVCGSSLDFLSLYTISFEVKKQVQSRRQYELGEKLRKNEAAAGDDALSFLGLGMNLTEKNSMLSKMGEAKVDLPTIANTFEDTGILCVC